MSLISDELTARAQQKCNTGDQRFCWQTSTNPKHWCHRCLMREAAKEIRQERAEARAAALNEQAIQRQAQHREQQLLDRIAGMAVRSDHISG